MQVFFQTIIGGISLGAVYALVALGFSLVYRTMGLVNFAHGNVVTVGAYLASTFYLTTKLPFALAMLVAIAVTAAIGLVIERVLRPLENRDFDLMLIGTIGFGIVLDALVIMIWGPPGGPSRRRCRPPRSSCSGCGSAPTTWSCWPSRRSPRCCWCCSCRAPNAARPCRRWRWTTRRPPRSASTSAAATRSLS
ncbi:branched-chain amino acid ABC transporter permease [Paractinoplanes durhamensis]|uniref:branched-chain amino acid ABC transporter permease n=1 Tax=Paractinoplanes durhamensis TaxID=113563 RepID=UPI0036450EE7